MKRNAILHGVGAIGSALVYAFFALPFYLIKVTPAAVADIADAQGVPVGATSGYSFLETALKETDGSALATFTAVMALLTLILAGVAFVASIFALLNDLRVIKNQKVATIANWVAFCATVVLALACVVNMISNACFVAKELPDQLAKAKLLVASFGGSIKLTAGWALTIVTTVLGCSAVATSTVAKFKK